MEADMQPEKMFQFFLFFIFFLVSHHFFLSFFFREYHLDLISNLKFDLSKTNSSDLLKINHPRRRKKTGVEKNEKGFFYYFLFIFPFIYL